MFQSLDLFSTAMKMARHAGLKQALSAQNMANADTPRYVAQDMPSFRDLMRADTGTMRVTRHQHLNSLTLLASDAPDRRLQADPNGNTVSLETEMIHAVDAKRQHDRALSIYRAGLSILRASITAR